LTAYISIAGVTAIYGFALTASPFVIEAVEDELEAFIPPVALRSYA
jgi:hypothetical protein